MRSFYLGIVLSISCLTHTVEARSHTPSIEVVKEWSRSFCSWSSDLPDIKRTSINLITGIALGSSYTSAKLLPYCKSVRHAGFEGEVILGVSSINPKEEKKRTEMFTKFNITVVYVNGIREGPWGQSICRYLVYLLFIEKFATEYDSILVSDVRDVFFQDDPFNSQPFGSRNFMNATTSLLLFEEGLNDIHGKATLRNVKINFRWLTGVYGRKVSSKLSHNSVLCSGTTIGKKEALVTYLVSMLYEAKSCLRRNPVKFLKHHHRMNHVCAGGADQGFHNYLFWNNLLPEASSVLNGVGPVYTLGIFENKPVRSLRFEQDEDGVILSPSARGLSRPVPIIHQWDRHKVLVAHVAKYLDFESEGISMKHFNNHLKDGGFSGRIKDSLQN